MANTTALAAARHHVLAAAGWDVEADGLAGSPPIRLVVGEEVHVTIPRAARLLGLGTRSIERVAVDANGAMLPADLERVLGARSRPADDRVLPGGQRQHRRDRSDRRARGRSPMPTARGCTSTARSGCGRRRAATRRGCPVSSRPTRGRPTRTSGSTFRTTAAS